MIPGVVSVLKEDFEIEEQPSKGFKLYVEQNIVNGFNDGIEAVKQAIYMILNTERYRYNIYSWNYGIELEDLIGEHVTYACPEIERRIKEALTQDERILSVDAFSFDLSNKKKILVTFTVHSIFGDIDSEKVVDI